MFWAQKTFFQHIMSWNIFKKEVGEVFGWRDPMNMGRVEEFHNSVISVCSVSLLRHNVGRHRWDELVPCNWSKPRANAVKLLVLFVNSIVLQLSSRLDYGNPSKLVQPYTIIIIFFKSVFHFKPLNRTSPIFTHYPFSFASVTIRSMNGSLLLQKMRGDTPKQLFYVFV